MPNPNRRERFEEKFCKGNWWRTEYITGEGEVPVFGPEDVLTFIDQEVEMERKRLKEKVKALYFTSDSSDDNYLRHEGFKLAIGMVIGLCNPNTHE